MITVGLAVTVLLREVMSRGRIVMMITSMIRRMKDKNYTWLSLLQLRLKTLQSRAQHQVKTLKQYFDDRL